LLVIWQSPRICESLMTKKRTQGVSAAGQKMGIFAAEPAKAGRLVAHRDGERAETNAESAGASAAERCYEPAGRGAAALNAGGDGDHDPVISCRRVTI
jgi:hypothetical protein